MIKIESNLQIESLIIELNSSSTVIIRKAAKHLRKHLVEGVCSCLLEAYERELSKKKQSWETQYELIRAAGVQLCTDFLPILEQICTENKAHDMITTGAGVSYFKIKRKNLTDVSPFLAFINTMNHSLAVGFLYTLAFDKMIPSKEEQKMILTKFSALKVDEEDNNVLLYFLSAASAGWEVEIVKDFLIKCNKANNEALRFITDYSLNGKYTKQHRLTIL